MMSKTELFELISRNIALIESKILSCEDDGMILMYLAMLEKFVKLYENENLQ